MRFFCLFLALFSCVFAKHPVTLSFIQSQPEGIARDFYIWYFISQDSTSIAEAKSAYDLVLRKNAKIEKAMTQKGAIHEMPRDIYCKSLDLEKLLGQNGECLLFGLKFWQIYHLDDQTLQKILNRLDLTDSRQVDFARQIGIIQQAKDEIKREKKEGKKAQESLAKAILQASVEDGAEILTGLDYSQRLEVLGMPYSRALRKRLQQLLNQNHVKFNRLITALILDPEFKNLQKALHKIKVEYSDTNTFFLLGINEVLAKSKRKALYYFRQSEDLAIDPWMKDRALWWQYLLSKNKKILETLAQSTFVDIFSIAANQQLKQKPKFEIISTFQDPSKQKHPLDITNPFAWQNLKDKILSMDEKEVQAQLKLLNLKPTLPHLVYFLNKQFGYKHNYFIFAYEDNRIWENSHQKALTYAVARQESHLLPALISPSYALGIMQIMPFNVQPFAKDMGLKDISLFDMFNPKIALKFGNHYLKELQGEFKNPLFVAYAYNGGPGFLRRLLAKNQLFLQNRRYEPWLSMELFPYEESRFYGMKVLANYVIYSQMLGKVIDLQKLLDSTLIFKKE